MIKQFLDSLDKEKRKILMSAFEDLQFAWVMVSQETFLAVHLPPDQPGFEVKETKGAFSCGRKT